jgi:putative glycerol-1-phosphate prenyltransferase
MTDVHEWQHVFKLDPDKTIDDRTVEAVCESGTDAILVGGTEGVTFENTIDLLGRIRRFETPCVLEVSNASAVVPGFDHYFIPFVMNATDPEWILKRHHEAVKAFGNMIPWQDVSMVGYCVLNPDSAVAALTKSDTDLDVEDVVAYAQMAAHMLRFPFFYRD